jgi:hypothetical protein
VFSDFAEHHEVLEPSLKRGQRFKVALDRIDAVDDLARVVLAVPEAFNGGLLLEGAEFGGQFRDVKDTSGALRGGPSRHLY